MVVVIFLGIVRLSYQIIAQMPDGVLDEQVIVNLHPPNTCIQDTPGLVRKLSLLFMAHEWAL